MDTAALFEPSLILLVACSVALAAGVVKGMVGFAMPMILVSGLTTFMPPELALAGLILPTVVTNGMQALRQGAKAAWQSIMKFRVFLLIGLVFLLASAQMVSLLPAKVMYLVIGGPVALFCLLQIFGWQPVLAPGSRPVLEGVIGAVAGFVGGMSGVWGPPTVAYLTALGTEKREQIRVQGVIYGLGAVALTVAHIGSGVLNAETAKFSAILIVPAVIGMWLGGLIHDRIDQRAFRRATLFILLIAALNLIRRAVF
ncbi:sulfite exporter TauE/SafE family protein [Mesobacterium sp. TK19101]|uniref:Probable membrane transporter protein n=1 Tax=Mesobacterium hydrothermale TaxID=3111907 RepID=A0ABU6HGM5_9RHOB|nr:sulfite exporter TauE/SafE family protein [Mesobacterium sp. TK19101]MEC3861511.1 sulfite exporter TauE/SafE family protein [Mesobacterium sp. TK19101]